MEESEIRKIIEKLLAEQKEFYEKQEIELNELRHLIESRYQQLDNRISYVIFRLSFSERVKGLLFRFLEILYSLIPSKKNIDSHSSSVDPITIPQTEEIESRDYSAIEDKTLLNKMEEIESLPLETSKEAKAHTEPFAVRSMDVQLNNFCNADCFFCVSHSKDLNPCIDFKGFETIARNVYMETVQELILTGGEPTVNKDLDRILRFASQQYPQTKIRLITNAIHMPPKLIDSLLLGNVASINISINASNAKDYNRIMRIDRFERVVENIRTIIKRRGGGNRHPLVCASLVLVKQNICNVVPFIEMGHELGVDSVYILNANLTQELSDSSPFEEPEAVREVLQQAQKVAHDKGIVLGLPGGVVKIDSCTDPWKKVFVAVEGEVNPCCGYDFRPSCDEHLRGNLLKQDLREFWYSGLYDSLRKGLTTGDPLPGCKVCYKQMFTET